MSEQRISTRIGLFALLLGVITLALFGSLAAANRALANADRRSVLLDARGAALLAERELRLDAEQLSELFGPLLPAGTPATAADRGATLTADLFDAVWVLDTKGRVASRVVSDSATPVTDAQLADAGAAVVASAGVPEPRVLAVSSDAGGGVLLTVVLTHRGASLGSASGYISAPRLLGRLRDDSASRPRLALQSSGRTLGVLGDSVPRYGLISASERVNMAGDSLDLLVAHAQSGRTVRTALWILGLVALAALLVGLARERRQAISLSERTSELERLYQEVARSNRMKSEFLANVSHELRTPLNAIVGFVEMLREGVYGELTPRQALPVDRIAASATHLRQLVDRLLDIAKIAAGRLEVHVEPLVLRPFVLNVASEMESLISERGLALSVGVPASLPRIRTDQTHLRQILINLIGNAVKYTSTGGIQVRGRIVGNGNQAAHARQDAASDSAVADADPEAGPPPDPNRLWVALHVTDTGSGIAESDRERIFDEFEQVNAGARTDSARRGTGLGLAISRRLAHLIGGELTVVSEPGRGSTFTVWLPMDPAPPGDG